jgi:hypothetical protein
MQVSSDIQQDVRDALSRIVRIEGALAALSYNALQQQTLATSAQQHQSDIIEALRVEVRDVVQMHRHTQESIQDLALSQRALIASVASVHDSVGTPSLHGSLQSSSSHSSSDNSICSFAGCLLDSASKGCSAGKSLRHMQVCPCCPTQTCRYLAIAEHMLLFQQAPRVTETDTCCWCGDPFEADASRDARSRHRSKCHAAAILDLKNPEVKDRRIKVLSATWSPLLGTPSKRVFGQADADGSSQEDGPCFSPPRTGLEPVFLAFELQSLSDDDFAFAAHSAFTALTGSRNLDDVD